MGIFSFGKSKEQKETATDTQQPDDHEVEHPREGPQQHQHVAHGKKKPLTSSSAAAEKFIERAGSAGWMFDDANTASSRSITLSTDDSTTFELGAQFKNKVQELRNQQNTIILRNKMDELNVGKLQFSDTSLVGRDAEVEKLKSILRTHVHMTTPTSRLISISGISGTGKTVLARQLERPVLGRAGYFCLGKFDLNANRVQPYTAFAAASHELAEQILELKASRVSSLKQKIERAVGDQGIHLLLEIFPGLSRVIEKPATSELADGGIEGKANQLEFTARQLFRVLSGHKESPVVLVLDDVQWADQQSLNLVEALLTDRELSFILITTSRSDEITSKDHPFVKKMDALREAKIPIETLDIGNLTEAAVGSVLAQALKETEDYTENLATLVYEKTHGNAFFVVQFMNMLVQDNLLTYNIGLMKWIWEDGAIQALAVADNVGSLLARKIRSLPASNQALLKIASCLGQVFEENTLSVALMSLVEADMLSVEAAGAVIDSIGACVDSNFIEPSGTKYNFAHDQIQAASFQLIPGDELPKIQLTIGRGLVKHRSGGEKEDLLFLSVDLCNSGRCLISDDTGRIGLAFQNLKAAEKAIHETSAFDAGVAYAKFALQCLDPEPAADKDVVKYMRLQLHKALAEASYCTGDPCATELYSDKVIDSDFPFEDKFVGYSTRMMSQFAQAQMNESMGTSLNILKKLGYITNLATYPGTMRILGEIIKTRRLMKSFTQEDLLNLPLMTDKNRLRGMNIVYRTATISHSTNPNLFLVLFLTAMRWTVKYGVCKYSPPIFAVYGLVVCGVLEDFDNGNMIGNVALALSERLQATQTVALTTSVVFAFVNHWKNDLRTARKPLEYGYLTGLQMGDINNAFINLISLDQNSWLTGYHDLPELERIIRESVATIRSYGHEYFAVEHCITWQMVLNLLGRCDDPLVMTGEAMDQEESIRMAIETNHKMVIVATNSFSGMIGYLYENYDHAVAKMKLVKKEDCLGYWTLPRHFGMLALAYIALAQDGKHVKRNLARAKAVMKMMKKWVDKGNPNIAHLLCLMDAEIAVVRKPDSAASMYEIAIKVSTRAGFRHDKALAHHRAARFFFVVKMDEHWGSYHIDKAIQAYCEWGALGVAKHLAEKYMTQGGGTSCRFNQEITMSNRTKDVLSSIDIR